MVSPPFPIIFPILFGSTWSVFVFGTESDRACGSSTPRVAISSSTWSRASRACARAFSSVAAFKPSSLTSNWKAEMPSLEPATCVDINMSRRGRPPRHLHDSCSTSRGVVAAASTPSTRRLLDGVLDSARTADTWPREELSDAALNLEVHAAQGVLYSEDIGQNHRIVDIVQQHAHGHTSNRSCQRYPSI